MQFIRRRSDSSFWLTIAIGLIAMFAVAATYGGAPQAKPSSATASHPPQVRDAYGHLPLSFEENRGQTDPQVKFLARGGGYSLFLTPTEAVLKLRAPSSAKKQTKPGAMPIAFHPESIEKPKFSVVRIRLEGANPNSTASGVDALPGHSNYFIDKDRAKWRTGIATYGGVRFESIYPGINLVYRGTQGHLEYDFVIAPNADPSRIRMDIEGADALSLDRDGNLVIKTAGGEVIQKAPLIYQESHGTRHPVAGGYALRGKHSVTFKLGAYDRRAPLIIDPLLTYVSYLGGSGQDFGSAIAVDSAGEAWVAGATASVDFPLTKNPLQSTFYGVYDAFVTKINSDGSALLYSTYVGGSNSDGANGIALDPQGNIYVTGITYSPDFPASVGAFQTTFSGPNGTVDAFVLALDPNGGLIYSTFLNGSKSSTGTAIAVDSTGDAYVTGATTSPDFPLTANTYQTGYPDSDNDSVGFATKFNPSGTALAYSTFLFPLSEQNDMYQQSANAIGLDGSRNAYIAISAYHTSSPFCQENCDSIIALNSNGTGLNFSTQLDGGGISGLVSASVAAIAVDSSGDSNAIGSWEAQPNGGSATHGQFLQRLDPAGQGLGGSIWVTNASQLITGLLGIALGPQGDIFIAGSSAGPLATTPGAFQSSFGGGSDALLMVLDSTGSTVNYLTLLGGSSSDDGEAVAVDSLNNVYVTGSTSSNDFPVTLGVFQPSFAGGANGPGSQPQDAFVARIVLPTATITVTSTPTPLVPTPTATVAAATATPTPTPVRTLLPTRVPQPTGSPGPTAFGGGTPVPTVTSTATMTATTTPTPTPTATPVGPVTYSTDALKFPTRRVDTVSGLKFVTVSNPKKNKAAVSIAEVSLQSPGTSGFNINSLKTSCIAGHPVEAGKNCRVAIYFAPKASGSASDTLRITGNMSNPAAIRLSGIGR